jgi:peptidyl-prolyl cis-trans isomerase SurA
MKKVLTTMLLAVLTYCAMAQYEHPVAFEIGNEKITTAEFKTQFLKSQGKTDKDTPTACTYEKRVALNDYADLYLNYRIKLKDAYAMGLDTDQYLRRELNRYRKELAAPYLIDSASMQRLLLEAYDRNQYALHAYHILCACPRDASPEDTLKAYQRAMKVYERLTTGGESFAAVAKEISAEDMMKDPNAKLENKQLYDGDLPFFTVFNMVYPFESAAYAMKVGEVSRPVRTQYGYHVIKLVDRIPYFGKSSIQHIWVSDKTDSAKAVERINEAYQKLLNGGQFAVVCRDYSDDRSTSENGGLLPDLPMNQMPAEYVHHVSEMKEGEYSAPFHTKYGWHILYCVSKEKMPSFEDMKPLYQQNMSRDAERSKVSQSVFAHQRMQKYGSEDYTQEYVTVGKGKNSKKVYKADLAEAKSYFCDTCLRLQWKYIPRDEKHDMRPIFRLGDQQYTNDDLLKFIEGHHHVMVNCEVDGFIANRYDAFKEYCAVQMADSKLEKEVPEFGALMDEYRNGLMIFSYNDKMVWSKAIQDTAGLRHFYQVESAKKSYDTPGDSSYYWNLRAEVCTVYIPDSICLPRDKALKAIKKAQRKNVADSLNIMIALQDKLAKGCNVEKPIQVTQSTVEQGNQTLLSSNEWKEGIYGHGTRTGYRLLVVQKLINPQLKTLAEGRGYYMSDYQNYLEQELMKQLKEKYHAVKHQEAIEEITY